MTPQHFRQYLFNLKMDALAVALLLEVNARSVRRWIANGPPPGIAQEIEEKTGISPHNTVERFIVGSALSHDSENENQIYLVHSYYPRFICIVSKLENRHIESAVGYAAGMRYFGNIQMIDSINETSSNSQDAFLDILGQACVLMDELNIAVY